jgi:hypothetical protein
VLPVERRLACQLCAFGADAVKIVYLFTFEYILEIRHGTYPLRGRQIAPLASDELFNCCCCTVHRAVAQCTVHSFVAHCTVL